MADIPRMAVIHGFAGAGKTTATGWLAVKHNALFFRSWPVWTPSSLLKEMTDALKLDVGRTNAERLNAIITVLRNSNRPVFFDDCDQLFLCNDPHKLFEIIRLIHDQTDSQVIFVGQEKFAPKLRRWEQLASRISEHVEFTPLSLKDASAIAVARCEVEVAPDLMGHLHQQSGGRARRVVVGLSAIEAYAQEQGIDRVDLARWQQSDRKFFLVEMQ